MEVRTFCSQSRQALQLWNDESQPLNNTVLPSKAARP